MFKNNHSNVIVFMVLISLLLIVAACAPAEPETVVETVVVRETVEVPVESVVVETVEVEKVVEQVVEVEVTAVPPAEEPVTITYFTFSAAPDHLAELDQMIAIFEESHPNITIEVETAPYEEYFTKLQALIAGGEAPDVFELNYENFVTFASKGVLADLSTEAEADPEFSADIYYPRSLNAFNYNDRQLGLPATFSTVVLFYNKDLFDQAGVDYPAADWKKLEQTRITAGGQRPWNHLRGDGQNIFIRLERSGDHPQEGHKHHYRRQDQNEIEKQA